MRTLAAYLRPYWKAVLLAPLLMLLEVYMDLLQPKLMASIVNDGVMKGDLAHVRSTGLLMLGYALIGLIGGIGCTVFSSSAAQNFGTDLREALFRKVQTFSYKNLDRFKEGSLVTRLTGDIVQVQNLVQMTLRILVRAPFLALGSVIMALTISPKLALILAVAIPLLFLVLFLLIRFSFPLFSQVQQKLDGLNTVLQENFSGIRVVKAFVRGPFEEARFGRANEDYTAVALKAARAVAINMPVMTLIMNVSIVAVLWFGGAQTWSGELPVGDLVAFINYVTQVLFSLLMVGMMMVFISRAKASADRINEVMTTEADIQSPAQALKDAVQAGRVEFRNVAFSYEGEDRKELVLKHLSFTAEAGQTLAILGPTGSGKSSLVSLIPRLYDPVKGSVLIDGTDVREMDLHHLRGRIGMVLQQAILFSGTIRDNIRFGRPEASQEEVEAAARAAEAHEFIMSFPDGYDTVLGQRGINLSGGQKQRISIARALLLRPAILILDDSTSAVDLGTESRIQRALKELMAETTCILIAQRISSVLDADRILVLEDGEIAAEGTHAELMESSRVYQDIYRSQLGKEEVSYGR
ncbi:ABC transporter ATP-binding protein [Paenibacillus mucilaginosus]|uniref:ABC transporter related protein n=1 Tax=Paenibacillus mucilaginosus (strain KNP414) TaxID=1036673 RepID=F8FGY8_PAEMK|nr:ABC transporter ATP-binding protein [Paenibacillus mucilaginosus]AEI46289.1 ABC transporter related protein [Paenibacillus mucilaginosus KNP414]MCG7213596.1 ABC transporter ATP-binding protein/permease [Paenibacillus mucilaginosus]WDM27589.1 ABC transporter ATP-binding protein [Paenibacillus mucilaginosus]